MNNKYKLELLEEKFCFSKFPQFAEIPSVFLKGEYCFIVRTDEELVVMSPEFMAPNNVQEELGFRGIRIVDRVGFEESQVYLYVVHPLVLNNINIVVFNTFNTIYIFFRAEVLEKVMEILKNVGHEFISVLQ